jgi:hypothetical protein
MLPVLAAILSQLAASGLSTLGNAVIAKGKDVIEEKLGVSIEDSMQTEEGKVKLLQLQQTHEEFLINAAIQKAEQDLKVQAMAYADTDSARKMQTAALQQDDLFSKRFLYYFATAWSVFAAIYVLAITFLPIPTDSVRYADTILGFLLGTVIATMIQFFFGSSQSSKQKDEVIKGLKV